MNVEFISFLAIRGKQGKKPYFLIQCPLRLVPRLFSFDETDVPKELRQLHSVNANRVDELAKYLLTNSENYILPPLVVSVNGNINFEPLSTESSAVGQLQIPLIAQMIIQDGQHRREAIARTLAKYPELGDDTVPVMLLSAPSLSDASQVYSDLQLSKKRRTQSQRILHNHESPLAGVVRQLIDEVPLFSGLTELEKTTISNRSTALFTLSAIFQATQALLGLGKNDSISNQQTELVRQFWEELGQIIPEWQSVINGEVKSAELRKKYIHAHGVGLVAIGQAGHSLITNEPENWLKELKKLSEVDWSRQNMEQWEGRAMIRGRMSKAKDSVTLTANSLKLTLGLPLTQQEKMLEDKLARLQ